MTTAEPRSDRFTSWLVAAPHNVAIFLGILALLWAIPCVYFGPGVVRSMSADSKTEEKKKDKTDDPNQEKTDEEKKSTFDSLDPNRTNRTIAFIVCASGVLASGLLAFVWTAGYPTAPASERSSRARIFVLLIAAITGLLLMIGGVWFTIDQFEIIKKWIDTRSSKNLWKVLTPVLVFIVGAAFAFAGAQFARAEERHNQTARRLVYATNFGVTALLLFLLLVIANVFFGAKLPNKLDTTESGFYSLHESTEKFIRELNQKVTVYAYIDSRMLSANSVRVMLTSCQELNPNFFVPRFINPTSDVQKLQAKFPSVNWNETALLITLGEDEARFGTVKDSDLDKRGEGNQRFFQGESQMVRELLFLSESKVKPTIYFTQGNGEFALEPAPGGPADPDRSATALKAALEKANLTVKPLTFDKKDPKVPDDAAVVVVLNPQFALPPEFVGAVRKYMTEKKPDGKSGRLIVASSPTPTPKNDGVQLTGLEILLAEYNINLVSAFLFTSPSEQLPFPEIAIVDARAGRQANNPIVQSITARTLPIEGPNRPLSIVQPGNAAYRATPLLQTISSRQYFTWLEKTKPADLEATINAMMKSEELLMSKAPSIEPRTLAAAVSEGESGRVVVFGTAAMFSDVHAQTRGGGPSTGPTVMATSIDWLRERPSVSVVNKQYGMYTPKPNLDSMRLMFLPLGLMVVTICGLAIGVWAIRRR